MIFIPYEGYAGQQSASIKVANLKLPAQDLPPMVLQTVLESDHGDDEAACYNCCSVGPDPTAGGQHHHCHLTQQGTCTDEGGL